MKAISHVAIASLLFVAGGAAGAAGVDEDAAQSLARKSGCLKCHAIDKKKDAPSYQSIAKKYKGKPDAEEVVYKQITTNPMVEVYGNKERHDSPKTKDEKELRNLVRWILTR